MQYLGMVLLIIIGIIMGFCDRHCSEDPGEDGYKFAEEFYKCKKKGKSDEVCKKENHYTKKIDSYTPDEKRLFMQGIQVYVMENYHPD